MSLGEQLSTLYGVDLQLVMAVHSSSTGKQNMFHLKVFFLLCCYLIMGLFSDLAHATDRAHSEFPYGNCSSSSNYKENSTFVENLNSLLSSLPSNASVSKVFNTSFGNDPDKVFALYMCLEYLSFKACHDCINLLAQSDSLSTCPNTTEAVVWEEGCQLRFSNKNFFGTLNVDGNQPYGNEMNVSDPGKFKTVVNKTLFELAKQAAFNQSLNMSATEEVNFQDNIVTEVVYALVQCTTDLSAANCDKCLQKAIEDVLRAFYFSRGARLLSRSCYVRYEFYDFNHGATGETAAVADNKGGDAGRKVWLIRILAIASACLAILLLVSGASFAMRKTKIKGDNDLFGQHELFREQNDPKAHHEYPYISVASIHVATNKFSNLNKLGEGGFGPVYKGVMRDGKEVAIKRLSSCSEQGVEEFTNEVLLLMKLQHKNLVRLLGFCADGQEKILVYEYMPNSSLDVVLFDSKKRSELDWRRRVSIINGIARGILYLHEDSRLRIIHRDLKASNVLLDIEMNPKISDFGMARIFAGSDGQANTAIIVGTYGYMAPEYAMEGIYSIKSDVFGFGVLLLEIITGTRNASFHLTKRAPSLVAYAWKLWDEGKGLEIVDRLLISSFDPEEFLRYLHVALLCVQEDANDRPTMSSAVVMLKSETVSLTQPGKPAFSAGGYSVHHNNDDLVGNSFNYLTISNIMPR